MGRHGRLVAGCDSLNRPLAGRSRFVGHGSASMLRSEKYIQIWGQFPLRQLRFRPEYLRAFSMRRVTGLRHACPRSEEHTSELQSLMRISYAVLCLTKKKKTQHNTIY